MERPRWNMAVIDPTQPFGFPLGAAYKLPFVSRPATSPQGGEQTPALRPEADSPHPTQPSRHDRFGRFFKAVVHQPSGNIGSGWNADAGRLPEPDV